MSSKQAYSEKDERAVAVGNVSEALGYRILAFALLIDIAYKAYRYDVASWDLFGIIIGTGLIVTLYQARQKVLGRGWAKSALVVTAIGAAVAAAAAIIVVAVKGL